jgi:hypothetical protein
VYHISSSGCSRFPRIPQATGWPRFSSISSESSTVPKLHRATVSLIGQSLVLTGHGPGAPIPSPSFTSSENHMRALAIQPGYWCFKSIQLPHSCITLVAKLAKGSVIAVSDGSFSNQYGTAAWVLHGHKTRCTGQVVCPGTAAEQNSSRSEVSGLLAILMIIDQLV